MNSNVIAMKPNQPVPGNRKLAPKEALWVHQAEMDALQLTGDWQGKASRLRAYKGARGARAACRPKLWPAAVPGKLTKLARDIARLAREAW